MKLSFNISRIIYSWLPELLRKPRLFAYLYVASKPLETLYSLMLEFRSQILYEATITGETNRLEKALQDKYDNPGIYFIQPTDYLDTAYIYQEFEPHFEEFDYLESEDHEPYEYDFLESEYDPDYDFILRVPTALALQTEAIKLFLKKYILAGKRYKIELY